MNTQNTVIRTDDSLMELDDYCNTGFPFRIFSEDVFLFQQGIIQWHWHRTFELKVIESGTVDCYIGSNMITLQAGDALFISPEFIHKFQATSCCLVYNVFFSQEFLAQNQQIYQKFLLPFLDEDIAYIVLKQEIPWCREVLSLLSAAKKCYQTSAPAWELDILSLMSSLWKVLFLHKEEAITLEKAGIEKLSTARLKLMTEYIENHFGEKIALEDISASANISKSEALRCFHQVLHTTPVKHLNQYRLQKACTLLKNTTKNIYEIAELTGFQSASYFNRTFNHAYGMPPASYRKLLLQKQHLT